MSTADFERAGGYLAGLLLLFTTFQVIYNLFFHPLRKFPGPKIYAATPLPRLILYGNGKEAKLIHKLHLDYGSIVRIGPNELSFTDPQAWRDLYGYGKGRAYKDLSFYPAPLNGVHSILTTDDAEHSRVRKIFSSAFSDKALSEQRALLTRLMDMLVLRLSEASARGEKIDMVKMYNLTTFDIMADLTFGVDLGLLQKAEYSPWVRSVFTFMRTFAFMRIPQCYPTINKVIMRWIPASIRDGAKRHHQTSVDAVDLRMNTETTRPDIWSLVLKKQEEGSGLTKAQMHTNAEIFMAAGTETTATLLSGMTYHLCKTPRALERLSAEIRAAFAAEEDITAEESFRLEYLTACVQEGLRMYPPVPEGLRRVIPREGAKVCGQWIPPDVRVSIPHYAAYHLPSNFACPDEFWPERFLPPTAEGYDARFDGDHKEVLQPFSYGPRNCIGKNFALHETKQILSRVLWKFDIALGEKIEWADQKSRVVWEKQPLLCNLTPVQREK